MLSQKRSLFCSILQIFICVNSYASIGKISGQLKIDTSWSPVVYLSHISNFNEMSTISNRMIISKATLDSLGNFEMDISFLPKEEQLFRLHLVKKGYPANCLIIGGKDENHLFLLANSDADIQIVNKNKSTLFRDVILEGYSDNTTFQQITQIATLSNEKIASTNSISKKELLEKSGNEKLRFIADTCNSPLVSLYAIYKSNFEHNYTSNLEYYKAYNKKWKKNHSIYFEIFRKELGISKSLNGVYAFLGLTSFLLILSIVYIFMRNKKKNLLADLSIQERKIFNLMQEGLTNQQISDECNIGLSTVKSHISKIFSKLNIKSRKEVLNLKE